MIRRVQILVLIDLVQDWDVFSPILRRLAADDAFSLKVIVSRWLLAESPRTAAALNTANVAFSTVRRRTVIDGSLPLPSGVEALLTASESDHPAHTAGWALTTRANAAGVATYTVQHGLRMPGLGGSPPSRFASKTVLCWFAEGHQPADLPEPTRAKLAFVGRVTEPAEPERRPTFDLAIFENLHDAVYSQAAREGFLATLSAFLRARGDLRVCIRTHPAGGWLDRHAEDIGRTGAVFMSSAEARASPDGANALIAQSRAVITTPSTVALDAAQARRPVALALPGGADFEPLALLPDVDAWRSFAQNGSFGAAEEAFLIKHIATGDAWRRMRAIFIADAMGTANSAGRTAPLHFRPGRAKNSS